VEPPDEFRTLPSAKDDLFSIAESDRETGDRIKSKIDQWNQWLEFGRVPQEHLTYLTDSPGEYNFYRQKVGNSGHRIIYEISDGVMTIVAIVPRTDRTYQMEQYVDRMDSETDE
jgi:mRNA interferase RelE/StbE